MSFEPGKPVKVRVRRTARNAPQQRGSSPAGDRPQARAKQMRTNAPASTVDAPFANYSPRITTSVSGAGPDARRVKLGTSPSGDRPQGRAAEMRAAPTVPRVKVKRGPGGHLLAVVHLPQAYVNAVTSAGNDVNPSGVAFGANIAKDAAELAVTSPSSVAKLASTAVTHPKQVPGLLAQPYEEFWHDPVGFVSEHPVSTALMFAPAVRVPGRIAGRVLRQAGKQTLERPPATLPGTALKDARTGSRDALMRAVQSHEDAANPNPVMTQADVTRRADEFYDFAQQHRSRVRDAAARQAKERGMTPDEASEHMGGSVKRANAWIDQKFGEEFGATQRVGPGVQAKATAGVIHDSRADAQRVADRLNGKTLTVRRGSGGNPALVARRNAPADLEFKVHEIGEDGAGGFAVVPKVAAETLRKHASVGSSAAPGSKIMRVAGKTFRTAVLPLSARWLAGQGIEAGLRAGLAHAGPADWLRIRRVVHAMNEHEPGSGDQMFMRVVHGGQSGLTGTAREFSDGHRTLAQEFEGTALEDVAHGITKAGQTKPVAAVRKGWAKYTHVVFNVVNGAIERNARQALAGQAIKQGPLMEQHILGLSEKAIDDAAKGLHGTHNQVQLGRDLDRMYGQYQKFSWQKRETLLHTTPFWPWYRNVLTFVTKTLPVDHPVAAALVANANVLEEDWRKANGLSLEGPGGFLHSGKPGFLLGGYPTAGGEKVVRYGRYAPVVPGDVWGSVADLVTPQFGDAKEILHGHDYTGADIKGNPVLEAALSLLEAHVPGLAQADRITGIGGHAIRKTDEDTVLHGKPLLPALRRETDPFIATRSPAKKSTGTTRRPRGPYGGSGYGGYGYGGGGGYGGNAYK